MLPIKLENKPTSMITGPATSNPAAPVPKILPKSEATGPRILAKLLKAFIMLLTTFPILVNASRKVLPSGIRSACKLCFIVLNLAAGVPLD